MKIFCISDSHGVHRQLRIPEGIDMILFAGDESNYRDPYRNESECLDFIDWYESIPVKYKLWCAGNHSTAIEKGLVRPKDIQVTTMYLEHEAVVIEGIKIFMSPYTPLFGDWSYMRKREKLNKYWDQIPTDTEILVTHGPPKGILDLTEDRDYKMEIVGDSALYKAVERIAPRYHIFGHVHDAKGIVNHGTRTAGELYTTFVNASLVQDGKMGWLKYSGIIIEI